MNKSLELYDSKIVEFVAVANEFCRTLEEQPETASREKYFLKHMSLLLPLLYLKKGTMPEYKESGENILEQYVDEYLYNQILYNTRERIGENDLYLDYQPENNLQEGPQNSSISEKLTDIYQDLKNFLIVYEIAQEELMREALYACCENFKTHWGACLTSLIHAIHQVLYPSGSTDITQ